jgi:vancomycin resistance protein YoaR
MRKTGIVIAIVIAAMITLGAAVFFFYGAAYRYRVLPNASIGTLPIGGLDRDALARILRTRVDALEKQGIAVTVVSRAGSESLTIFPVVVTEDTTRILIQTDTEAAADALIAYGKSGNTVARALRVWRSAIAHPAVELPGVSVDTAGLRAAIEGRVLSHEIRPKDARVAVHSADPLSYDIASAEPGITYHYDEGIQSVVESWKHLEPPAIQLTEQIVQPTVHIADIQKIIHRLPAVFSHGPLSIVFENREGRFNREWTITERRMMEWLAPMKIKNGDMVFGLDERALAEYVATVISIAVDVSAQDAKFRVDEQGKVVEFAGSRAGVAVDVSATVAAVEEAFAQRTLHDEGIPERVPVVANFVEPRTTTAAANNLGISEVLGVGTSDFSGSAGNRIKNIRNAVQKLNGVLVKPGETFSTLEHIGPFTEGGGYLPELVIKGDSIEPEIGGGLCQIGTTLFRMAMMGGMPITMRRNHSLVVHYYNDPRNGNPGTDATIYDPAPDFRFVNDTGHHILIQTDMNTRTAELNFTLWGTNDGRSASYTAPIVSKWIPYGQKQIIETTKLKPGETKCQNPFKGALASFVYTRQLANGIREDRVFESSYRPLPEICLVGVAEKSASSTFENAFGASEG